MNLKHLVRALLATAAVATVASAASAQEIKIRFAHVLSTSEPMHKAVEYFAKNVAERTKGKVQITIFPGEQLGYSKDVNEMIRQGANVISSTDAGYLSDFVPDIGILTAPYLVTNHEDYWKIIESDWYKGVEKKLEAAGFKILMGNGLFGARYMLGDKPFRTPADFSGVTVRVAPNVMWIETFRALGARPTPVQWSEVYNALSQNVVQAVEAPLGSLWGSKLHETRKTLSLTGHFTAFQLWPINIRYFNKLPKDVQQILLEEGHRAGIEATRLTLEGQKDYLARFKAAGVTVIEDVDQKALQQATTSVYTAFPKWTPNLRATVMATIK